MVETTFVESRNDTTLKGKAFVQGPNKEQNHHNPLKENNID